MAKTALTDQVTPTLPPAAHSPAPATTDTPLAYRTEARPPRVCRRYVDFLPETEAITERRHSPYATWLILTLCALVIAFVAWMHFARIEEVATVPGIVRAAAKAKAVSHPEGGRVVMVLVRDGDSVKEGEPLILLDDDLVLRAPVAGVIKDLKPFNPGATIGPGETVAGIVRTDDVGRVEIEVRVSNHDVGGVTVGQDATMKMQAYDWVRYGTLKGTVVHIAPDAVGSDPAMAADPRMQPAFIARIVPDQDFLGNDPRRNRLMPGMTATVDLHVGERSILDFLTTSLRRTVGDSLHER